MKFVDLLNTKITENENVLYRIKFQYITIESIYYKLTIGQFRKEFFINLNTYSKIYRKKLFKIVYI